MRVAVVFDTPYSGWDHPEHECQMEKNIAAWKTDKPDMEYQIAYPIRERGMEYSDFIQRIVDAAIARYERS